MEVVSVLKVVMLVEDACEMAIPHIDNLDPDHSRSDN